MYILLIYTFYRSWAFGRSWAELDEETELFVLCGLNSLAALLYKFHFLNCFPIFVACYFWRRINAMENDYNRIRSKYVNSI